jgi:hypothetical protein
MVSCDDCQDCIPLDEKDPGVNVSLIDSTSIIKVLKVLDAYRIDSVSFVNQLNEVNEELEDEALSNDEKVLLRDKRDSINSLFTAHNDKMKSEKTLLKSLQEGQTEIQELYVDDNPLFKSFNKSNIFRFPLRPDRNSTTFIIIFKDRQDTLQFNYQREIQEVDRRIKVIAKDIEVGKHTFQKIDLDTTNIINETHAKFYF